MAHVTRCILVRTHVIFLTSRWSLPLSITITAVDASLPSPLNYGEELVILLFAVKIQIYSSLYVQQQQRERDSSHTSKKRKTHSKAKQTRLGCHQYPRSLGGRWHTLKTTAQNAAPRLQQQCREDMHDLPSFCTKRQKHKTHAHKHTDTRALVNMYFEVR